MPYEYDAFTGLKLKKKNEKKPDCHFGEKSGSDICPGYACDIRYRDDELNINPICINCRWLRENMEA